MTQIHYMHVEQDGDASVTAFVPGASKPLTASTASHGNFDKIMEGLRSDDPSVIDLFDISIAVAKNFDALSERVSVANGRVYFDGDEVHNSIAKLIVRFLEEDDDTWIALVNFMENVAANPNDHSREQLFDWLDRRDFTITEDGKIVAYKGVSPDLKSIHSGPGIVNGEAVLGRLDNTPGNVVEIARSKVHHDPTQGCSTGLHVGTYGYASGFGQVCLKVEVNPRDVVSVPTDCAAQKVRCCRYEVVEKIDAPILSAFAGRADEDIWDDSDDEDDESEYCIVCDSFDCPNPQRV